MRRRFQPLSADHRTLLGRIAANLRRLRAEREWTQAQVAERCDLSLFTIQCVEAAETSITTTTLALLCEGFDVEPGVFFEPALQPKKRKRGRPRGSVKATKDR